MMNLRTARKIKGVSQSELAAMTGVDQTTISDLERGRNTNPSWNTVTRIARALNVTPEELFGTGTPSASKEVA